MFAVPGWSVSPALLKKQDEQDKEVTSSQKKRKRKQIETDDVTSNSLSNLYQQHIEKTLPKKSTERKVAVTHSSPNKPASGHVAESQERSKTEETATPNGDTKSIKSQKAEFRKAKREAQSKADKQKALEARAAAEEQGEGLKSKKNKKQKRQKSANNEDENVPPIEKQAHGSAATEVLPVSAPAGAKLTPLQVAMRQKLVGARFRHLNQTLYTSLSTEASKMFEENPTFFEEYHAGFRTQVESWPENPVDTFVHEIQRRAKVKPSSKTKRPEGVQTDADAKADLTPLPTTNGTCRIADLGCGDASLASKVSKLRLNVQVLSYDLAKPNKFVTKADIANLPLDNDSINVAVFCLALMGTNWIDFIEEAWRVLHWKGELWIAEIKSRFGKVQNKRVEHSVGNRQKKRPSKQDLQKQKERDTQLDDERLMHEVDEVPVNNEGTDVSAFVEVLQRRGFVIQDEECIDLSNKMFVRMRFSKGAAPTTGKNFKQDAPPRGGPPKKNFIDKSKPVVDEVAVLKPCLYKVR